MVARSMRKRTRLDLANLMRRSCRAHLGCTSWVKRKRKILSLSINRREGAPAMGVKVEPMKGRFVAHLDDLLALPPVALEG